MRSIIILQGVYWLGMSGSQMTILPLILSDPNTFGLTGTSEASINWLYNKTSKVSIIWLNECVERLIHALLVVCPLY